MLLDLFLIACTRKEKCVSISRQQTSQAAAAKERCFCDCSICVHFQLFFLGKAVWFGTETRSCLFLCPQPARWPSSKRGTCTRSQHEPETSSAADPARHVPSLRAQPSSPCVRARCSLEMSGPSPGWQTVWILCDMAVTLAPGNATCCLMRWLHLRSVIWLWQIWWTRFVQMLWGPWGF